MDHLDLVFRRLVWAAAAADALTRPIDLGEILDGFVPFSAAQRDGIEREADYHRALMQLVAGERGLVFADDALQDDVQSELAALAPDTTILRTYLNSTVRLATEAVRRVLAQPMEIDVTAPAAPRHASAPPAEPNVLERVSSHQQDDGRCPYCATTLPVGRSLHFCPTCGMNLRIQRCPGCSAEMESTWKFCVTCGRSAD